MNKPQDTGTGPATGVRTVHSHSAAETSRLAALLAARLGADLPPGLIIALHGDLGAGKTTFIQGLAAGLGVATRVTSPTFVLVNEYSSPRRLTLIHIDAYRLSDIPAAAAAEADTFGIEEILAREDAVVAVEWAERLQGLLPADVLHVELTPAASVQPAAGASNAGDSDERVIRLTATGAHSAALLAQLPL